TDEIGTTLVYKWVVKKDDKILMAYNQRELKYTFSEPGEYLVSLSTTDQGGSLKTTKIWVLSGDKYANAVGGGGVLPGEDPTGIYGVGGLQGSASGSGNLGVGAPLKVELQTLPPKAADGRIHLLGDGKIAFDLHASSGDIIEYRIDQNVFNDSDGNGIANDDIDNAGDASYLTGKVWEAVYKNEGAAKVVAEVTLVSKDGKKSKEQVEIAFDKEPVRTGDPVAALQISPEPDSATQRVMLFGDEAEVSFYARPSSGNIVEYRIDKDIFVDSDKDGNPANDIDNLNDASFKTGDVWRTTYKKTDAAIIAQLIVVGPGGKGSRLQRGIAFSNRLPKTTASQPSEIRIEANKSFVRKGDPVEFQVAGLQQNFESYTFHWDFNGDGTIDKEVEGQNSVRQIYDEVGSFIVKVKIKDKEGNSGD
ncbi:MAG: PKD domain-containing protein, partial [bacterium]|nr:PKD domain-containing protein [bacterium]